MGDQAGTYSLHEEKGDFERCMKMQEENMQSIKDMILETVFTDEPK